MRPSLHRFTSPLCLVAILTMASLFAGTLTAVGGLNRSKRVRVPRAGVQRVTTQRHGIDGRRAFGDVNGAVLATVDPVVGNRVVDGQRPAAGVAAAIAAPAPPTNARWLPELAPLAPATTPSAAPSRDRGPPAL